MPEFQAREVLDFMAFLKSKRPSLEDETAYLMRENRQTHGIYCKPCGNYARGAVISYGNYCRMISFRDRAWADYLHWQKTDKSKSLFG
uniref:DUF2281 domain-containing protein n=1 Tax=Candidatus Kentrum sp. DK TaxID=2126562 RepID=A0A450RXV8_9GAMM|nr:MAG: hypothetical protein BECKDK2373B_GA0170837_100672 [Candidatus Kentron sp. DK]